MRLQTVAIRGIVGLQRLLCDENPQRLSRAASIAKNGTSSCVCFRLGAAWRGATMAGTPMRWDRDPSLLVTPQHAPASGLEELLSAVHREHERHARAASAQPCSNHLRRALAMGSSVSVPSRVAPSACAPTVARSPAPASLTTQKGAGR